MLQEAATRLAGIAVRHPEGAAAVNIARTHVQTARLWVEDAIKEYAEAERS